MSLSQGPSVSCTRPAHALQSRQRNGRAGGMTGVGERAVKDGARRGPSVPRGLGREREKARRLKTAATVDGPYG